MVVDAVTSDQENWSMEQCSMNTSLDIGKIKMDP